MLQNPHHYPRCHAPPLARDCPVGAALPRTVTSPPRGVTSLPVNCGELRYMRTYARLAADDCVIKRGELRYMRTYA